MKYITPKLETERLILKKGTFDDYKKVYEYDFTKLRDIDGEFKFVKLKEEYIYGFDTYSSEYDEVYDWIIYLKDNMIPIGNILADREEKKIKATELSFNLHAGADAALNNKITVDINSFNTTYLGIQHLDVVGPKGDNGITATYAIDAIADALQKVSDQRAELGAIQNRLEHSIANLDNVVENTTAAESRIRDTDMAAAMVEYSKNNILAQAGQSMLAQANSSAEGVMALLQ